MKLSDEYKELIRKTRESLQHNFDPSDPNFVSLSEELKRIFKKKNLSETTQTEMVENMHLFRQIYEKAKELNRKNELLKAKYENDEKYTRIHKRLVEKDTLNVKEMQLHRALMQIKNEVDNRIEEQKDIVNNEPYFVKYIMQLVVKEFKNKEKIPFDFATSENINQLIVEEYKPLYTH